MSSYYRISPKFWRDPVVEDWPDDAKLLAFYMLSCEHRTTEGLYRLPKRYATADLNCAPKKLDTAWQRLIDDGFMAWDPDVNVVLIHKAIQYQPPANQKVAQGALKRLAAVPRSPLLVEFARSIRSLEGKAADFFREGVARLIDDAGFEYELLMGAPTQLWPERRAAVLERDGHVCAACGATTDLQVDHVVPRSLGGTHEMGNLQVLCAKHNLEKRDRTNEEWLRDPSHTVAEPYRDGLASVSNSLALAQPQLGAGKPSAPAHIPGSGAVPPVEGTGVTTFDDATRAAGLAAVEDIRAARRALPDPLEAS